MSNSRIWVIAGALLVVVILALGGLLGVKPQLDAAQLSTSDRESVETLNLQHQTELVALREKFAQIDAIRAEAAALRAAVPAEADLDGLTGELAQLEAQHGVKVTSYAPLDAAPFVPAAEIAESIPSSIDATRFVTIPISITVEGKRDATLEFVKGLQSGARLVLVSDVTVSAEAEGVTTTTINGLVYVLLNAPIVDPAAPVAGEEPTAIAAQ